MSGTHENESGESGESRMDRMQRMMAQLEEGHIWFREEHTRLLAAQAVLTERLDRLIEENRKRRQEPT